MTRNKYMKKIAVIVLLLLTGLSFYKINALNHLKHKEIQQSVVNHPENLPETKLAARKARKRPDTVPVGFPKFELAALAEISENPQNLRTKKCY